MFFDGSTHLPFSWVHKGALMFKLATSSDVVTGMGDLVGVDSDEVQETQEIQLETAEDDNEVGVKDDTGDSSIFRPAECNYKM